jgi:hypothetical protein
MQWSVDHGAQYFTARDPIFLKEVEEWIMNYSTIFTRFEFISVPHLKLELRDWEEMLFMSCCDHHIISNSTFSWWGAYINPSLSKQVYYPLHWFHKHSVKTDISPIEWNGY